MLYTVSESSRRIDQIIALDSGASIQFFRSGWTPEFSIAKFDLLSWFCAFAVKHATNS